MAKPLNSPAPVSETERTSPTCCEPKYNGYGKPGHPINLYRDQASTDPARGPQPRHDFLAQVTALSERDRVMLQPPFLGQITGSDLVGHRRDGGSKPKSFHLGAVHLLEPRRPQNTHRNVQSFRVHHPFIARAIRPPTREHNSLIRAEDLPGIRQTDHGFQHRDRLLSDQADRGYRVRQILNLHIVGDNEGFQAIHQARRRTAVTENLEPIRATPEHEAIGLYPPPTIKPETICA